MLCEHSNLEIPEQLVAVIVRNLEGACNSTRDEGGEANTSPKLEDGLARKERGEGDDKGG
jgi:hypothetical protein